MTDSDVGDANLVVNSEAVTTAYNLNATYSSIPAGLYCADCAPRLLQSVASGEAVPVTLPAPTTFSAGQTCAYCGKDFGH